VFEAAFLQHLALLAHAIGLGAPQHQLADGISEALALDGQAFGFELGGRLVIGRQQHLERRALLDLRVELAG
jgi:hypothetical protein